MKRCCECKQTKSFDLFPKSSLSKDGYRYQCKECINKRTRMYKLKNKDKIKMYNIKYKREHQKEIQKQFKVHCLTDAFKLNRKIKRNHKRRTDPRENINHRMEVAIRQSLQAEKNGRKWEDLVGYTAKDLKKHLEFLFVEGMTWEKFLEGKIHIDHIIPRSSFLYRTEKDKTFKECWSLKNLQPLWAEDNIKKGNSYVS